MLMNNNFLYGKKVGVLGRAKSGIAAANLAKALGADVLVSEAAAKAKCGKAASLRKDIRTEFGGHSAQLLDSDIIIKSPGVHQDIDILKKARKKKIPVWSEIELAARLSEPERTVAITGTNGKTTTTALTGEIFKAAGRRTVVAGNIGAPLASAVENIEGTTTVVLEVSSYQLEDSPSFHPEISAILNITPDHLEHHHTMRNYISAKTKIFANQTKKDYCVLNYDDPVLRRLAKQCPATVLFFSRKKVLKTGVYFDGQNVIARIKGKKTVLSGALKIPGLHNRENALAAVAMALAADVEPSVIEKVLAHFPGVEHRIEYVATLRGAEYYNDSKGTNVDSTRVALESFDRPIWLILGGRDKGAPYAPLKKLIKERVRGILLIGEAAAIIRKELKSIATFYDCGTLRQAVKTALHHGRPGDVVLLSPACASFDQFKDYEDRGRKFKQIVKSYLKK
jgi:UDP-N-acetylmuramoylalanine--D-glutamate ligase